MRLLFVKKTPYHDLCYGVYRVPTLFLLNLSAVVLCINIYLSLCYLRIYSPSLSLSFSVSPALRMFTSITHAPSAYLEVPSQRTSRPLRMRWRAGLMSKMGGLAREGVNLV